MYIKNLIFFLYKQKMSYSSSCYSSSDCNGGVACIDPCYVERKTLYCDPDTSCKYNNKVYKKYCKTKDDCSYTAPDVFYPKQDAVVRLFSQATVDDSGATLVTVEGSGFIVVRENSCKDRKSMYVVTTSSLVMLNPNQVRIPAAPPGYTGYQRMENFYAEIQNVNGKCKNYIYQLRLIGIDGVGNIALLEIDLDLAFNKGLPCINHKCHPYLDFEYCKTKGCDGYVSASRYYATGDVAFLLGKGGNNNNTSITQGVITNNRFAPPQQYYFEAVVTDADSTILNDVGSPLLNKRGKVIGVVADIVTDVTGASRTLAISEFSALPPVEAFAGGIRSDCNSHLEQVQDSIGPFYRYVNGYLGLDWHYTTAADLIGVTGVQFKEIEGIVVDGATALSPFFTQFNGVTGSIITHINGCHLGQIAPQVTPAAILSRLNNTDNVCICYRVLSDLYAVPLTASNTSVNYPTDQDNPF